MDTLRKIESTRRADTRDAANELARMWKASERRHQEKRRRENRALWYAFHMDQAERLRRTMSELVAKHEAAAAALLDGPGESRLSPSCPSESKQATLSEDPGEGYS